MRRAIAPAVLMLAFSLPALAADLSVRTESGRSVFQRGERVDLALRMQLAAPAKAASLEFWAEEPGRRVRIGTDDIRPLEAGQSDYTYTLSTGLLHPAPYRLLVRANLDGQTQEVALPLEIVTDVPHTRFKIMHMGIPGWVLPTGDIAADSRRWHFNFMLANVPGDTCHRGNAGPALTGGERAIEEMLRNGINFLKYPTGYGWGLTHCPIKGGMSWYDPEIRDISAQLMQYYAQSCRRFPNFEGLDPIDEPVVGWRDKWMDEAFKKASGLDAPNQDERGKDLDRYVAYQVFRNHVFNDFNAEMKDCMHEVTPSAQFTIQQMPGILTGSGLYPVGNTFLDVNSVHIYDHWPSSNNGIAFFTNLNRANRQVFWNKSQCVFTGCYGIMPDQWRAAWALGMSEKLEGHGYFLGAGELNEQSSWPEYSLAEMIRINRLCEQYGEFFMALQKPVEPLALWYSLAQAAAAEPGRLYEHEVIGAFYALKRAHFPVTIITDEDVRAGLLKEHKVLLIVDADYMPKDLREAVERFARGGGRVVADRLTKVQFPDMARMDTDFREFAASQGEVGNAWYEGRQPVSMLLRRDMFAETSILRDIGKVEAALVPLVERPVLARSPHTFLAVQRHGEARYIFVANEASVYRHPCEGMRWITMQESVPAEDEITIRLMPQQVVYDLWTGEKLAEGYNCRVRLRMRPADLRVLCVFPGPVQEPQLSARVAPGEGRRQLLTVRVKGMPGGSGAVPVELLVRAPGGRTDVKRYGAVDLDPKAENEWSHGLSVNDTPDKWTVCLRDLLSGRENTAEMDVGKNPPPDESLLSRWDRKVIMLDERSYPGFAKRKPLWVVPGQGCEAIGQELAQKLTAEVRKAEEIRKTDTYPDYLNPEKNKGVWMMPRWAPLDLTVGANLVLVGTPENNILIKDINESGMLARPIHNLILGKGEGMVLYVWSPFDLNRDAVIVAGYDEAGLRVAKDSFLEAAGVNYRNPRRLYYLPADLTREDAPAKQIEQMPTISPAWRARLTDAVRKLDARGGLVAAGTFDSRLCVFNTAGLKLWEREFDYQLLGVAVSPDGQFIAASAFPRTYVLDRDGQMQFFYNEAEPSLDDVEGLAVQSGTPRLIKGTWTGKVEACGADGRVTWTFPPPPKKKDDKAPQPEQPAPQPISSVRAIAVLPDGTIAAGAMDALLLLDTQGKELARVKMDRLQDVCAVGDRLLAASFTKKLFMLNAKGEKVWEVDTPDFVMAADASADGSTIAAALFGGDVMLYDAAGKLKLRARMPFECTLTGIAVDEKGQAVWLSTWEGDVLRWDVK